MGTLYIGVMSGTSLDGVDVALCSIHKSSCKLVHSHEYPFPSILKEEILFLLANPTTLFDIGTLNTKLGILFADSINSFIEAYALDSLKITAIGLHGQTLWHSPSSIHPFSMQLGCPNVVHANTGIQVVADFRSMDIANGGQGAPFAPAFHQFVFAKHSRTTAVVNIGGIANVSILGSHLEGWDTGTGNVLLDFWVKEHRYFPYDKDGDFAHSGTLNTALLEDFLSDPYFALSAPKSTGREYFNWEWLSKHLQNHEDILPEDVQRTLLELTAQCIAKDIESFHIDLLIVCGGGAKNTFLMQRLQALCSAKVQVSDDFNVSSSSIEAMAFAWLAYKRIHKEALNLSSVTGATQSSLLGGIYG